MLTRIRFLDSRKSVMALCVVCLSVLVGQRPAQGAGQVSAADRRGVIAFEGTDGLYVVNAAGGIPRVIPSSRPGDGNPRWSPDGRRLAFERYADDNWDVYVMNADGSGQRRLTFSPADDDFAMWSPRGRSLVFQSGRDRGSERSVYAINVTAGAARRVVRDGKYPDWSADGRIVFTGGGTGTQNVFTVRPYGSDRRRLGTLNAQAVRVSDDGRRIAFQADTPTSIFSARIDGTHVRPVAVTDAWEFDPAWSPDGDWVIFDRSANRGGPYGIYAVPANGGTPIRLISMPGCCADWSATAAGLAARS